MTDVRFYHLKTKSVDEALPALLSKALEQGRRILVCAPDRASVDRLNERLWVFDANSFMPHGVAGDDFESDQPVLLTAGNDNPNGANTLFLTDGAPGPQQDIASYTLCCEIFDGRDPQALEAVRARWLAYKAAGHTLTYWQQTDQGGWEKKDI